MDHIETNQYNPTEFIHSIRNVNRDTHQKKKKENKKQQLKKEKMKMKSHKKHTDEKETIGRKIDLTIG